jgi:hypothetical protein
MTVPWVEVHRQVAIGGNIRDERTGKPITGAEIIVDDSMDAEVARTNSRENGDFYFMDLANGQYELNVSIPGAGTRYGKAQASATVSRTNGNINRVYLPILVPPSTVTGHIAGLDDDNNPIDILLAEIRLKGSPEIAYSDSSGSYQLIGLEIGLRTLLVAAQGYLPVRQDITLSSAGEVVIQNFVLVRES